MVIKFLHWNIYFKEKIENIVELLYENSPDVVCLNELSRGLDFNHGLNTADYLGQKLKLNYFTKEYMDKSNDGTQLVFSGIFSKYPMISGQFFYTSQLVKDKELGFLRGSVYLEADVELNDKLLTFATDHLLYFSRWKENELKKAEVGELIKIIRNKKHRFVFCGDLNAPPNSFTINQIKKHLFSAGPAESEKTAFSKDGNIPDYAGWVTGFEWRLDYVFVTKDMKVKSAKIIKTEHSDHLPILIEVEI